MKKQELYVYTTETYQEKGLIKVGQCALGRHKTRIREQFGTSNPELPIILFSEELPRGVNDHKIHSLLEDKRVKGGAGKEWFKATVKDVQRALNSIKYGTMRSESYSPRQEQTDAIKKAEKWFNKKYSEEIMGSATHSERFLLNAKMRFGKCFTGLEIAKSMNAKKVLIITYKPSVIGEWLEVANDHVRFKGWLGIRAKSRSKTDADPSLETDGSFPKHRGNLAVCVSLQDLQIDASGSTKMRLQIVATTKWDLIIFDEVHFGSQTERANFIIDSLKWKKRLDLSGTPFRLIQEDDFCSQQVFTYSYLDEQENKKNEIANNKEQKIYQVMPDLDISTIEITEDDINEQLDTFYSDDLDFSLNELFKANSKGFKHKDAVLHFLDGLTSNRHTARSISIYGKLGSQLNMPAKRHSVWWLNRVDSVKALIKVLKNHPYFSQFEIINAAGCDAKSNDEDITIAKDKRAIQDAIKKVEESSNQLGTITLTCRRFLTGVTIKEWESILVLNDVKSPEAYFQAIFRVQSAWSDKYTGRIIKPKAWVFDFAISRCLRLTYAYADALADQLDQQESARKKSNTSKDNLTETINGLCQTLDIKRFYEGDLKSNKATAKDVLNALNLAGSKISLAKRITSDALIDFSALRFLADNPHLMDVLKKVKGYRTQEIGGLKDFVRIGIDANKLKKNKGKSQPTDEEVEDSNDDFVKKDKDKKRKKNKKWFATQIKRLAICMSDFIYMTEFREYNVIHVIETKDPKFFETVTGITKEDFSKLCEIGFINKQALNRIVREFRHQEETSLNPEEYILEQIIKNAA